MCLFVANLLFLSCKYLMGNKAGSEKDMQTLRLSCNIQQRVKEQGTEVWQQHRLVHGLGLSGLVWGGSRVGFWEKLPEDIPVSAKIHGSQLQDPMETHSGAVCEGLQPLGRTHVGNVCGEGWIPVQGKAINSSNTGEGWYRDVSTYFHLCWN